jgi:GNAT superfamily N-acetyltransferase
MSADVQIKQFELSDQEALLSFLRVAYTEEPRKSDPAFWKWHFLEGPYVQERDVPLWIAKAGAEVVGQLGAIPIRLKVGDEERRAIWYQDFNVRSDYRNRGLGKRLVLASLESYSTALGIGFTDQAVPVFRGLKWETLGVSHRYQRLLFPGDALKELARFAPLRKLFNICYAPFRPRISSVTSSPYTVREITSFDGSFDDLWQRASRQWPCAMIRSSRYLEWQFMRQPGKKFDAFALYKQDRLVGYAVLFFRKPERDGAASAKAAISDLCYDGTAVIDELLRASLRLALERRVGSLVTDVLDPTVEERLRRLGFWRIKRAPQFMVNGSEGLLYELRNWFLTRADCDITINEGPNL